jgi:hypothetical protein
MSTRFFTPDEANALLPKVRQQVKEMLRARQRILDAQADLWPVLEKALGNGGSKKAGALVHAFDRIQRSVQAIQSLGVQVKDVNTGLVDFPSIREGRVVLLCWRYDEPEVAFWHDLEAGLAGRQPL